MLKFKEGEWKGLKKKFNTLTKPHIGTGNPNCPNDIKHAKRIHIKLIQKSELSTAEEDEDYLDADGLEEPHKLNDDASPPRTSSVLASNNTTSTSTNLSPNSANDPATVETSHAVTSTVNARMSRQRTTNSPSALKDTVAAILARRNNSTSSDMPMMMMLM